MEEEHHPTNYIDLSPERLEAFSDGVLAIIITITVLEFKTPVGPSFFALIPAIPLFLAYLVSFQTIGTYWNNHHHLLRATKHISADIMWANLNLLFWLSLIPFAAGWLGENHGGTAPTALYAAILFICAISYSILQQFILKHAVNHDSIKKEFEKNSKGLVSPVCYFLASVFAFINPYFSYCLILFVSVLWFMPDQRIAQR